MDFFKETIIKHKKDAKDFAIISASVLGTLIVMCVLLMFIGYLGQFSLLAIAAVVWGEYLIISSRNIEYEYILTNGDLDIDKIVNMKRRKRVLSVNCKNFSILASVHDSVHQHEFNKTASVVHDFSSHKSSPNAYFALFDKDGQKIKLIFEPTEGMLEIMKRFNPQKVFLKQ